MFPNKINFKTYWPPPKKAREGTATDPDNKIRFLESIDENPHNISQMVVSRASSIYLSSVYRIIIGNNFHPCHVQLVQVLKDTDCPKRLTFGNIFRENQSLSTRFYDTDETAFCNNGGVHKCNMHYLLCARKFSYDFFKPSNFLHSNHCLIFL